MKIVINALGWSNLIKGIDRYYTELIRHLGQIDKKNYYFIFYGTWQKDFSNITNNNNFKFIKIKWVNRRIARHLWHAFIFPFLAYKYRPDIIHLPCTMPLLFKPCKSVTTIHDQLLEFSFTKKYGWFRSLARRMTVKMEARKSDRVIAVSPLIKSALTEKLKINSSKITVIFNGVNTEFFNTSLKGKPPFGISKPYILFVSVIDKNKNLETLIRAYSMLSYIYKDKYQLIIAGKAGNAYSDVIELMKNYELKNHVTLLGHVTKELPNLYANAYIFVMPSHYEGFSLPVLEAMASGVPTVVSKTIAIADYIKNDAVLFDPNNINELKDIIESLLEDQETAIKLGKRGIKAIDRFSWISTAQITLETYNAVGNTAGKGCLT